MGSRKNKQEKYDDFRLRKILEKQQKQDNINKWNNFGHKLHGYDKSIGTCSIKHCNFAEN